MKSILFAITRTPYFYIGIVALLVFTHTYVYMKGRHDMESRLIKKNVEKGIQNNEILSNRPDDITVLLRSGKF